MKKHLKAALGGVIFLASVVVIWIVLIIMNLPDVSVLKHYRPAAAAEVMDKDGKTITQYYDRKFRIWVPISDLPDIVIHAVVTAEDDTFFDHTGVNFKATWDAFLHDVKKRRLARGGSTITQQMIKNVLLSKEKTIGRKVREFFLAREADDILTKRQILEIYLNEVEWGENIYGIEAASRFYLDKHASDLAAAEAAMLAGMLPNPRYFNPYKRMDKAKERQERVLSNMLQAKLLSEDKFTKAVSSSLALRKESASRFDLSAMSNGNGRPCYQKALEHILLAFYGEHALYRQGISIRTTLDKALQVELGSWTEAGKNSRHDVPDTVVLVKEGDKVRAVTCGSNEADVRFKLDSRGSPYDGYDISTVSMDSVHHDEILTPENNMDAAPHGEQDNE